MKRALVTSVRVSKDVKTNENNCWLTVALMPTKMQNGSLFYPKSSDISVSTCAGEIRSVDKYAKYKDFKIGDVVDIHYGFNEFTQKPYVDDVVLFKSSAYKESDLII